MSETVIGDLVAARTSGEWCLFVDRDGVINCRIVGDYVRNWRDFEWLPGAKNALKILRCWSPYLVVVTNQQGVGKQLMSIADVASIHAHMQSELAELGFAIDDFEVCPHLDAADCPCRKPKPGMVLDWLKRHPECDPALSVMVGDSPTDLEMARHVASATGGCIGIEVNADSLAGGGVNKPSASFPSLWDFAAAVKYEREGKLS